jgi:hypothetical protein
MSELTRTKKAPLPQNQPKPPESVGGSLDAKTSAYMESRFGHDFSQVRVHNDAQAAESAQVLGAHAYTLGEHIVFGRGEYAPQTTEGRKTLAHELTHVVQQGGTGQVSQLQVGSPFSAHEAQADQASRQVLAGGPVPTRQLTPSRGVIQRTGGGAAAGGITGAILGAGIGAFFGPIGALVGGLIGGLAGMAIGDAASANRRGLTGPEKTKAQLVFGNSMDYNAIRVTAAPVMSVGGFARTLPGTIYFPTSSYRDDFSGNVDDMHFLIHEMTHAWQYQHGASVATTLWHALFSSYDYAGPAGLRQATAQGKHFREFNTEQQGDICADYYRKLTNNASDPDLSAYLPFIQEVQATSAPSSAASGSQSTSSPSSAPANPGDAAH